MSDITRKIRALFDKAASTDSEAERDTFIAHANRLAAKYAVTEAMLAEAKPSERDEPIEVKIKLPTTYGKMYGFLASAISEPFAADVLMHRSPGYKSRTFSHVSIVGMPKDIEVISALYNGLALELASALSRPGKSKTWKMNFALSFTGVIRSRMKEEYAAAAEEVAAESGSTDLVLLDANERVGAKFKELFPVTSSVVSRVGFDSSGNNAGGEAGRNADLSNRGRLGA